MSLSTETRRPWLLAALLSAVTLAALQGVCRCGFVGWDDPLHTYQNPALNPLSAAHLASLWRAPYGREYIPVAYTLYALLSKIAPLAVPAPVPDDAFTRFNPHVFHAANLILHLVNVLLVFALLRRIVRRDEAAFAGALLFAVHPVQVEAVAWISELRGLLAGFFGLLALGQYLHYARAASDPDQRSAARRSYILALAAFLLALLSKPSAAALPLLAWVLDWGIARRPFRRTLPALAGWALAALPIFWLTHTVQPVPRALLLPLWQRPLIAADALAFYLVKLLGPVQLGIDYGRTPSTVLHSGPALWAGPCLMLLLALLVWRLREKQPWLPVALGLFTVALLPVLGFVPFMFQSLSTVGDRYLYLAMLGPSLAVASLWPRLGTAARLTFGMVVVIGIGLSARQVTTWHDSQALYEHALAVNPDSGPMHYNLAGVYTAQGKKQAAIAQYQEALRFVPDEPTTHFYLGKLLGECGDRTDAAAQLREATRLEPRYALAHYFLAQSLSDMGLTDAAIAEWQKTASLVPQDMATHYYLGYALLRQNRLAEAATQFHDVLRLQPNYAPAEHALRLLLVRKAGLPTPSARGPLRLIRQTAGAHGWDGT